MDTRRVVLRRQQGRFKHRPAFHRRESCGTLGSFKLERPVFGGRRRIPLRIAYRLERRARVGLQIRRGRKVLRTVRTRTRRAERTFRLHHAAKGLPRGDYKVRITVVRGSARTVATLTSRKL